MNRFDKAQAEIREYYEQGTPPTPTQLGDIGRKYNIGIIGIVCYNEIERRRSLEAKDPSKPMDHPINREKTEKEGETQCQNQPKSDIC